MMWRLFHLIISLLLLPVKFARTICRIVTAITGKLQNKPKAGIIPRGAPKTYHSYNDAPESPGLYRFHCPNCKEPAYIGQTINIRRRFYQHVIKGDKSICPLCNQKTVFKAQVASSDFEYEALMSSERRQIRKHRPHLNKRTGGGGRRPKK